QLSSPLDFRGAGVQLPEEARAPDEHRASPDGCTNPLPHDRRRVRRGQRSNAFVAAESEDGARERMLASGFCAGSERDYFVTTAPLSRHDIDDLRLALCQRAGLVERDDR